MGETPTSVPYKKGLDFSKQFVRLKAQCDRDLEAVSARLH